MARVTVEDCVKKVEDRFELVVLAARRAKDIYAGAPLTIERNDEKNTVLSLREIADDKISVDELRGKMVKFFQRETEVDDDLYVDDETSTEAVSQPIEKIAALDTKEAKNTLIDNAFAGEMSFSEDNLHVKD